MSLRIWGVVCLAATLSGCLKVNTSQAPMATTWESSDQQRMQAAHHWDVLARNEARNIMANQRLRGRPLYVFSPQPATPFARGFHSLLESQLVQQGALVSTQPEGSVLISPAVQVVRHSDRGFIRRPPGTLTMLAAGVAWAFQPLNHWSEPALALIPGAAAFDAFSGNMTEVGNTEVIITTRASEFDTLLYSSSNIYYVNAGDSNHYEAQNGLRVSSQW
ncbi:hypothetical protein [Kushneria pakistanensis]|nr:hypothetical protein [Kushneria pakistanensis]